MTRGIRLARVRTLLLLLVLGSAACSSRDPDGPARHLMLISLDTLRADRLSCYGYGRATSPAIDALAREGARFEQVVTETTWTLPAHLTLFTGLAPESHGVVRPDLRMAEEIPVLAEILRAAGFRTFAGTGGGFVARSFGFARGFERFDDRQTDLAETLRDAKGFLNALRHDERAFVFVHTMDVHCPYEPAQEFADLFRSPEAAFVATDGRCGNPDFNSAALTPGQVLHLSDRYDASIREADAALGEFLGWLSSRDLRERSLVVVTSDHGEEFAEHGRIGHEGSVYAELLRVPLILAGPGIAPSVIDEPIGLKDVAPTLLDLLGVAPAAGMDGSSYASRATAGVRGEPAPRFSSVEWKVRLRSVVAHGYHLVLDEESGEALLYSAEDRLETRDLSTQMPERAAALRALVEAHFAGTSRHAVRQREELDEDELARLRALGYGR